MTGQCRVKTVFCSYCKSYSHSIKACRKYNNSSPNQNNDQSPTIVPLGSYHPVAMPPGATPNTRTNPAHQNPTGTTGNRYPFQQYIDMGNQPRASTVLNTPHMNNMSPAPSANMTEALTQILTQVVNGKKDDLNKKMAKKH